MAQPKFKAPHQEDAIDNKRLIRDTRTTFQQIADGFKSPIMLGGTILMLGLIPLVVPEITFIAVIIAWLMFHSRMKVAKKEHLPFRMPYTSFSTDYGDPKPGRRGFSKAAGSFLLGNTFGNYTTELWMGIRDMLTHTLIFGTTGSGKTETLVSLSFNAIAMGSGLFYVDPKGSPKLIAQLYVMSRLCGRDDDFRCINYLTAVKSGPDSKMPLRTTNMINPFSYGNAESLSNMLNSLIPKSEGGNAIFSSNAQNLMKSVMYALVELRDRGEIQLSSKTIRDYLTLTKVMELASRTDFSRNTTDAIRAFLTSVGWQEGKTDREQPKSLAEQFGYARSYFGAPLNNLTDTYSHIYDTHFGEIDMRDVVMNRRILCIVIPSLAMAPEDVKSLGVISLSAIRIAIAVGLGTGKEGSFSDILYSLPTDAPAPFLSITDEYAAIPTPGYVEVLTQGRGLGIAAIVASQDFAGIEKADKEGAQQLLENTKTKVFMKGVVKGSTFEIAEKLAGEMTLMETQGYNIKTDSTSIFSDYRDKLDAGVKDRNKIHLADIMEQIEGEFHAFFGSTMVRGQTFYANPPLPADFQIQYNHLVAIYPPEARDIDIKFGTTSKIIEFLINRHNQLSPVNSDQTVEDRIEAREKELIDLFAEKATGFENEADCFNDMYLETLNKPLATPMDTAIAAFMRFHIHLTTEEELEEIDLGSEPDDDFLGLIEYPLDDAEEVITSIGDDDDFLVMDEPEDDAKEEMVFDDDAFIFGGQSDFDDDFDKKKIQAQSESISEIINLHKKVKNSDQHEPEIQTTQFERNVLEIEAAITPDINKAIERTKATVSSVKRMQSNIISDHPGQPVPPNDKKIKDSLSNRLDLMIKNAIVNKD